MVQKALSSLPPQVFLAAKPHPLAQWGVYHQDTLHYETPHMAWPALPLSKTPAHWPVLIFVIFFRLLRSSCLCLQREHETQGHGFTKLAEESTFWYRDEQEEGPKCEWLLVVNNANEMDWESHQLLLFNHLFFCLFYFTTSVTKCLLVRCQCF